MTVYTLSLFVHVLGAVGIFAAFALEWTLLAQLRRATTAQDVQPWTRIPTIVRRLAPISMLLILIPGIYMAVTTWRGSPWPWVGLVAMLLLPILGAPSGRRLGEALREAGQARGDLPAALRAKFDAPVLRASIRLRMALLVGVVYLMTTKPGRGHAVTAIGAAFAAGAVWALPRRPPTPARRAAPT